MAIIKDGQNGYTASVNSENRLLVHTSTENVHNISHDTGRAYGTYVSRNLSVANTDEVVGHFLYNGSGIMVVSQIVFSIALTSTDFSHVRFEVHVDPTSVSGGTAHLPIPMNRGRLIASESVVLSGDTTVAATLGGFATELFHAQLSSHGNTTVTWDTLEGLILERGDSFVIVAKGDSAGVALPGARASMRSYEQDKGE